MPQDFIKKILTKFENKEVNLEDIIKYLLSDKTIYKNYPSDIRRFTIIGELTNEILQRKKVKQKCKIMAIGDIKYHGWYKKTWKKLIEKNIKNIKADDLIGYDLAGFGNQEFREDLFKYMNHYYNFDENILKKGIVEKILPVYGATDGFTLILNTLKNSNPDKKIKLIYPETSFLANIKIAENILGEKNVIKLNKPDKNNYFIDKNQIDKVINNTSQNIYYVTPVGNPTGQSLDFNDLYSILLYITRNDKDSIILLDNVYVGLLKNEKSQEMFSKLFKNGNILSKIIFIESLSKTLGMTGIRIGWIWTMNSALLDKLKYEHVLFRAGFSKLHVELIKNMFCKINQVFDFQEKAYNFFSKQRMGFLKYIKQNYSEFFDFEAIPEILDREGLYILLKVHKQYSFEEVFARTGIIGVKIDLSDGVYIRYSFGNVDYF